MPSPGSGRGQWSEQQKLHLRLQGVGLSTKKMGDSTEDIPKHHQETTDSLISSFCSRFCAVTPLGYTVIAEPGDPDRTRSVNLILFSFCSNREQQFSNPA